MSAGVGELSDEGSTETSSSGSELLTNKPDCELD
jgi:hypothetical protein